MTLLSFIIINAQNRSNFRGLGINVDSVKQKLASAKEDTAKVNLLFYLAGGYTFSYPDTAASYAAQGYQLAQKINYKSGEAHCLGALCLNLTSLGNFPAALNFGFQSLSIFENLHDTTSLIWTNIQLMNCYRQQEDYEEALIFGYKAKSLFRLSHPDSNQISVALSVIGSVYEKINQLDSALYYAQKAYTWDKGWSGLFQTLGEIYAKMGHKDLALDYYRKGIPVATKEVNSISLVAIYNDMSKVFESTGNTDSSIYYANRSITQEGVHANPEGLLSASTQLASLYESRRMPDSTIKYLKLAIALNDSLSSRKKTREAQNFSFNEKLHRQELASQQQQEENKIKIYTLFAVIILFLLTAFFLWRNNRHKQEVNKLLQQQKEELQNTLTELKSTQAQLIQSEKMASLGELTAGIAHEIQNPLNFVNNFSEVSVELADELKDELNKVQLTAKEKENLKTLVDDLVQNQQKINHHGKRADSIVKDMLQHSRTSTGQKEFTDINALADEYLRLSYHGLRAKDKTFNATLQTDFDENVGKINIISQDIGRVFLNLFTNAFYSVLQKKKQLNNNLPAGQAGFEPTVYVSTKKLDNKIEIRVKDNGAGIPQKVMDKIFQPFFTTKPVGQGTGLGLSLSYDIITKGHGGTIKVETKEGECAEFIIVLPVKENSE